MLFSLPAEVRARIWFRARFLTARSHLAARLVARPRYALLAEPLHGHTLEMAKVSFRLGDGKLMELAQINHYYGLEGYYAVNTDRLPVTVRIRGIEPERRADPEQAVNVRVEASTTSSMWFNYPPRGGWYECLHGGMIPY